MKAHPEWFAWALAHSCFAAMATAAEPVETDSSAGATWEVRSMDGTLLSTPVEIHNGENQLFFRTGDAAQHAMQEIRERLKDPERRAVLRTEHKSMLERLHPDMEQELGIDSATKDKVLELLADEQLMRLESSFWMEQDHAAAIQKQADAETQSLASLRALLGQDGLEKLQLYLSTTWEREQVKRFDALLLATEKLQPEQKSKLAQLFSERNHHAREHGVRSHMSRPPSFGSMDRLPSPEETQRHSQLLTIEGNETALRRAKEENPILEKRAAEFLSPAQVAALARMNEEEATRLQAWIEQARLQAGLSPQIPERAQQSLVPRPTPRKPFAGETLFEFNVTVNRSAPVTMTHTGPNATPIMFEAGDGLWIEVTPTLFEDHWLDVHLDFYEQVGSENRRLDNGSSFGTLTRLPDGTSNRGGMSTNVVTGSKGYAVKTQVNVQVP